MTGPHLYRISALASGFVRMWRGWRVIVPVIVVNAVVQALLVWPAVTYSNAWWMYLSAIISAVVFGLGFGLVASTALEAPDGPVSWASATGRLRANLASYTLWAIGWLALVAVGLALDTIPGLVVMALTPFLLLAALDGHRSALARNLKTIRRRFWRWLLTALVIGVLLFVGDLSAGLFTFFIRNPLAALVVWLVAGLVITWFTTAWALVYRSAWAEPVTAEPAPEAPADEPAAT